MGDGTKIIGGRKKGQAQAQAQGQGQGQGSFTTTLPLFKRKGGRLRLAFLMDDLREAEIASRRGARGCDFSLSEVIPMFSNPQPPPFPLEHEKLSAYREARALAEALHSLGSLPGEYDLRDQLRRASASILLNIAEGASRQLPADKRRFYRIARGSTGEVGAAIDLLRIRRRISPARHAELRYQLVQVARLLGGLCRIE